MMNIFFDELSKEYPDKEIIIAMDQAGWHKAKDLKLPTTIEFMFLPLLMKFVKHIITVC